MVEQLRASWNSLLAWLREVESFECLGAQATTRACVDRVVGGTSAAPLRNYTSCFTLRRGPLASFFGFAF